MYISAARVSTLFTFAQSVYLMFSAVYVGKETIEHVLLSAGEAQGHHHHAGDESPGTGSVSMSQYFIHEIEITFPNSVELPLILSSFTFFSLLSSAILFDNNSGIVSIESVNLAVVLPYITDTPSLAKQ